jgi:hypothetical protein
MSASAISLKMTGTSPRWLARKAGICQLLAAITATIGEVIIPGKLIVSGNATATGANILSHVALFWWGFASSIAGILFHIIWAVLLCSLLKPVNERVSACAAYVMIVACSIQALASLLYLGALVALQNGASLNGFSAEQLNALAFAFLKLSVNAIYVFCIFFGVWLLLIGFLIFKSTFLPRVLGVPVSIAGLAWMTYIVPPFAIQMFTVIAAASALGEIPLELWLIVKAVNDQKWKEQALTAASSMNE